MKGIYTAVVKQDGGWWVGWVEEIPGVNCQERTREALLDSLEVTLREALELNRSTRSAPPVTSSRSWSSPYETARLVAAPHTARLRASSRGWSALVVADRRLESTLRDSTAS